MLILALCGALFLTACSQSDLEEAAQEVVDTLEVQDDIQEQDQTEDPSESNQSTGEAIYTSYSEDALTKYKGKNKVIFFHATWCSTCKAFNTELENKISELPSDTVVLKADYDSETDLRAKYGVNLQHTLVFIDDTGETTRDNLIQADVNSLKSALQ
jgi:thiol-disulfide isomerase/thioredoxin